MSAHKPPRFFRKLSLLMAGVVSSLALIYAIIGNNGYFELRRRETVNRELKAKADRLRRENNQLLSEIKALKSDPKAIEKIAREELGMVRDGEVKIMTSPDRQVPAPADRQ